jgi:hypothetical protein
LRGRHTPASPCTLWLVMPRSIEAADHPPSTWSTRVALSNAGRRELPLARHSISGSTMRNLSDRVSKNQKRCGAAQGAPVTNHRQHTRCASAAHFITLVVQYRPRRQPDSQTKEPPPEQRRRRRRLNSIPSHPISSSSAHRQRPSLLCFHQDVLLIVVLFFDLLPLSSSSPLSQSIIDTLGA